MDSFLYMMHSHWLQLSFGAYAVVAIAGGVALLRSRSSHSGLLFTRRRCVVAVYVALTVTPSIITGFFVASFYGPAFVGLLFTAPAVLVTDQRFAFLRAAALLYGLPMLGCFAITYALYPCLSRLCARHNNATNVA